MSARPTLKTISELTGLAVPTISRALNDAPDIGADTKMRVRETARRIGYVPNRAGVRLRTGKTNVISLVLSTEHDMMNFTARLISTIAGALRNTPYHLIITPYMHSEDPMVPVKHVVETGSADAVIINQICPEDPRVAYLMERKFPFATHGRTDWSEQHPYVDFDNEAFGWLAVERLVGLGRHNIRMVAPPLSQTYAKFMTRGAYASAEASGANFLIDPNINSDSPSDRIRESMEASASAGMQFDGVICGSTNAGMGVAAGLEAAGVKIGQDVDIIAKEVLPFLNLFRPEMLVVYEDVQAAGIDLARAAIQAIEKPNLPPVQVVTVPKP